MPFAFIQSEPQEIQADALVQPESSIFPQFIHCFGDASPAWPRLEKDPAKGPAEHTKHPIFSGQRFPENPYLFLGLCPPGKSVWELSSSKKQLILIHTAPAHAQSDWKKELYYLSECYKTSMQLAASLGCRSIVFPLLPGSLSSFPPEKGLDCATFSIGQTLLELDANLLVWLAIPSEKIAAMRLNSALLSRIQDYIRKINPDLQSSWSSSELYQIEKLDRTPFEIEKNLVAEEDFEKNLYQAGVLEPSTAKRLQQTLNETKAETFQQMLFRLIDQKNLKDTHVYKRANIDRRLFSKIRSHVDYQPSKNTVLALAIALELDLNETQQLLEKAGFTLSHSLRRDIIIEFFIQEKNYNIFLINEVLFCYSLPLLGITENGFRGKSERMMLEP